MKKGRIIFWLVAIAAIAAVAVIVPMTRRQQTLESYGQETFREFSQRLAQTPAYAVEGNAALFDDLALRAHDAAWAANHRLEGDASAQVLIDVPGYEKAVLRGMIEQARAQGATAIADDLARVLYEWYEVE